MKSSLGIFDWSKGSGLSETMGVLVLEDSLGVLKAATYPDPRVFCRQRRSSMYSRLSLSPFTFRCCLLPFFWDSVVL